LRRPLSSTLFPYTTLFRSQARFVERLDEVVDRALLERLHRVLLVSGDEDELGTARDRAGRVDAVHAGHVDIEKDDLRQMDVEHLDRKSTRLNSSHVAISYA